jgi:hypothetical protein
MQHHDAIRQICATYLPSERIIKTDKLYTIEDFDAAVAAKNTKRLETILNNAWFNAPDSRSVYSIPGFTEMCNLLDETVEGFVRAPGTMDEGEEE